MKRILLSIVAMFLIFSTSPVKAQQSWDYSPIAIGLEMITGKVPIKAIGHNAALSATYETVTATSAVQGYINHADSLDVVCAGAQDDTSGTGIRTITIYGLDDDWEVQSEIVTLAGSATVRTANEFLRVYKVEATTAGSGGVASNTILVQNAANDTTLATIATGETRAHMGMFSVPDGKSLYIMHVSGASASAVLQTVILVERKYGTTVWLERDAGMVYLSGFDKRHTFPIKFDAKSDVEIRAKGNTGNIIVMFAGWYQAE